MAGLVIETLPQKAAEVAERLAAIPGVEVQGSNEYGVAITWAGATRADLDRLSETIVAADQDVTGVYPTYVGDPDLELAEPPTEP